MRLDRKSPARAALQLAIPLLGMACAATRAVAPPAAPTFFPPAPAPPRLQFVMAVSAETDVAACRRGFADLLRPAAPPRRLLEPRGVDVYQGVIAVADGGLGTVVEIDPRTGRFAPIPEEWPGHLIDPLGIDVADDGTLYVADGGRRLVLAFAPGDRRFLRTYGDPRQIHPCDVVAVGGRLYVTDTPAHRIQVYDRATGELVATLGREGTGPGEFRSPTFISAAPDGALYVTDFMNSRVQALALDGKPLDVFARPGSPEDAPLRPKGIAVDPEGWLHVVDGGRERARILPPGAASASGSSGTSYGGAGTFPGHMELPFDLTLDRSLLPLLADRIDRRLVPRYLVLVTNQAGPDRLIIYACGDPAGSGSGAPAAD